MRLRPAGPADAGRVGEIVRAAYARYVERMGREPRPMLEDYAEVVGRGRTTVAERDGTAVGVLVLDADEEGFVVDNVAVDPAAWGTGVGRVLLERAEQAAREAAHDSIYLYTHETMVENLALYTRIGYVEYDRRGAEGDAVVYLRKPLARD